MFKTRLLEIKFQFTKKPFCTTYTHCYLHAIYKKDFYERSTEKSLVQNPKVNDIPRNNL